MKEKRAVYYAIDMLHPLYLLLAGISIKSVRRFNKTLRIYLFLYGGVPNVDLSFFRKHKVTIINKKILASECKHVHTIRLLSLEEFSNFDIDRLIFLEADTICFQDINILFKKFDKFDFYARKEYLTDKNEPDSQVSEHIYEHLTAQFMVRNIPVFNTGICIYNNKSYRKIPRLLDFYDYVYSYFGEDMNLYPFDNRQIIDEVVTSLTYGKIRGFTYGIIDDKILPWYHELLKQRKRNARVPVVRFGNHYFVESLFRIGNTDTINILYQHFLRGLFH